MITSKLSEKWGSKDAWLRALYVRSNIIWLFRDEFVDLELGRLKWLEAVLADACLVADISARRFQSNQAAFDYSVELIKDNIEQRLQLAGQDAELMRLKGLTESARLFDLLQQLFDGLAKKTRQIYVSRPSRHAALEREWLITHPRGSRRSREFNDRYHINAQTEIDSKGDNATVQLQVHLDDFGIPSLLAVPALFTHELVCHVHANEDQNDDRSIWAEGVMDWTSLFFFEKWCGRLGLPYGPTKHYCKDFWEERLNPPRDAGRYAAVALVDWLTYEQSIKSVHVANAVTARLALEVNAAPARLVAKDALASRMINVRRDEELQEAVRAWRAGLSSASGLVADPLAP